MLRRSAHATTTTTALRAAAVLCGGAACVAACPRGATTTVSAVRPRGGSAARASARRVERSGARLPPATPAGAQCGFGVEARPAPGVLSRGAGVGGLPAAGLTLGPGGAVRAWLAPAAGAPLEAVDADEAGEPAGSASFEGVFAGYREVSELRVAASASSAASGEDVGLVATAWPDEHDSEVVFARIDPQGRASRTVVLDPSPRPDREPVIAPTGESAGRFAVAWARGGGGGHAADIEFALVERDGRVAAHTTLVVGADPEGMALVAVPPAATTGNSGGAADGGAVASSGVVSNGVASSAVASSAVASSGGAASGAPAGDAGADPSGAPGDASAAGAAVARPTFVLVYTPGSEARSTGGEHGVVALVVGSDGALVSQQTVARGRALWPVAAWDGEAVGVAFHWEPRRMGFVRLGPDGAVRTPATEVARLGDPLGTFRPASMAFDRGRFWVGSAAYFHGAVTRAAPPRAYVVAVAPDGTAPTPLLELPPSPRGTEGPLLLATPAGVRGVFGTGDPEAADAPVVRAFDLVCRAAPAVANGAPPGPCDPRVVRLAPGRHVALRTPFRLAPARGGDVLAAYEAPASPALPSPAPSSVAAAAVSPPLALARLAPDGRARWTVPLAHEPGRRSPAALAATDDELAAVYSPDEDLVFVALDPATGRERSRRTVRARTGLGPPTAYCLAPRAAAGYLLVWAGDEGVVALRLRRDGAEDGSTALPDAPAFTDCALARTDAGFWLALSRPGLARDARDLYLQALDAQDAPVGAAVPLAAGFARDPVMVRAGAGALLLAWADAREREVLALELGATDGAPLGPPRVLAGGYELRGLGLLPDGDRARLVWAIEGGYGERRVCAGP